MSDPVARLARAEADAALARERFNVSLAELQVRLEPRRLARDAAQGLSMVRDEAKRRTADTARRHPGTLTGLVAMAGLFLARRRIIKLFRRRPKATAAADAS